MLIPAVFDDDCLHCHEACQSARSIAAPGYTVAVLHRHAGDTPWHGSKLRKGMLKVQQTWVPPMPPAMPAPVPPRIPPPVMPPPFDTSMLLDAYGAMQCFWDCVDKQQMQ